MKGTLPWILLLLALLVGARLLEADETFALICSVIFAALMILYFICSPELEQCAKRREEKRYQQERAERIRARCERLTAQEAELRRRFEAGELRMLVEWWEEDDLYIDENAHLFFIFTDDTAWETDLYPEVQERLKPLLASFGIGWKPGINFHFDSRILYPPTYAGQKYYNPDGSVRKEFLSAE